MEADFTIEEVYNTKARDQMSVHGDNLILKIRWKNSREIAFVSFDLVKRRYSHILLDYLASKIRLKGSYQMDTIDLNGKNMEGNGRKVWPNHSSPVTKEGNFSIEEKIDPVCIFLEKGKKSEIRNKTAQILDYDSIVPLDSNIAIPVFFRPKSRVLEGRKIYQVRKKH